LLYSAIWPGQVCAGRQDALQADTLERWLPAKKKPTPEIIIKIKIRLEIFRLERIACGILHLLMAKETQPANLNNMTKLDE
jgi:hypothetical protein